MFIEEKTSANMLATATKQSFSGVSKGLSLLRLQAGRYAQ